LLNHFEMSCTKNTGTDSFAHQAFSKIMHKKDEKPSSFDEVEPMAGRCSELLLLKLNCTFALFQHCSAACLESKKQLSKEKCFSFPLMKWLHHGKRNTCMENTLKRLGHLCFAKFMFQHRGVKSSTGVLTPHKRKGKDTFWEDTTDSKKAEKKRKSTKEVVEASLQPCLDNLATKEDLAGLVSKEDLETATSEVRGQVSPDAAGNISLAMSSAMAEAIKTAEQKIREAADLAISKMNKKQHRNKASKKARKVSKGRAEMEDPSMFGQSESVQSQDQQQLKQEAKPHAQSVV